MDAISETVKSNFLFLVEIPRLSRGFLLIFYFFYILFSPKRMRSNQTNHMVGIG
jgi:hypothetical protein